MMEVQAPLLNFPPAFCCNCGDTNCTPELQDTRITRVFLPARTETTFQLPVPVCDACRPSTRRRPLSASAKLLIWLASSVGMFGLLKLLTLGRALPQWIPAYLWVISAALALGLLVLVFRLRRPRHPQTSWYQPVRIRQAQMRFEEHGGQVAFMKLAFTNHEYLNVFNAANRAAIEARSVAAVKA
jgi:hypothetical protein